VRVSVSVIVSVSMSERMCVREDVCAGESVSVRETVGVPTRSSSVNLSSRKPSVRDQLALVRTLMCTDARRNSATCGTDQDDLKVPIKAIERKISPSEDWWMARGGFSVGSQFTVEGERCVVSI